MVDTPEALAEYPHVLSMPVIWNDLDAMNHVNNTVYFRYLETGRIGFLTSLAAEAISPSAEGLTTSFALAEVSCRFKVPLTFPDEILVASGIEEIGEHHVLIKQAIYSKQLGFVVAEGSGKMVYYDHVNKQRAPIAGDFLAQLQEQLLNH